MNKVNTAIIFGISGQDGSYLSHFLLRKGYKVIGITRNKSIKNLYRLKKLNIIDQVTLVKGEALDLKFCQKIINSKIDEIYYECINAGASGGKIIGSGGGGFLLIYCKKKFQNLLKKRLKKLPIINFKFTDEGSKIIFRNKD